VRHTRIVDILGWRFRTPEICTYNYQWFAISVPKIFVMKNLSKK